MSKAAGQEVHALSCVNCRQRKVKCAKTYPCPHCVRGGLECVFPSRKKDRAPRRTKNHELLNRLAKLEAIVGQADPSLQAAASSTATGAAPTASELAAQLQQHQQASEASAAQIERHAHDPQKRCPLGQPTSKDDPAAKYVSGEFWANLSAEVEGIKNALEQPSDSEDDGAGDDGHDGTSPESSLHASHSSPSTFIASPAVFTSALAGGVPDVLRHPSPVKMKKLRELYFENVDVLLKILHRPTVEKEFDLFIVNPESNPLSRPTEALFFAMYFIVVTSLTPEACQRHFGEDRAVLVSRFRQGAELALARADYLNSSSLEALQALTLYDTALRNHAESRASWALLGLVYRLAQAIGLHRDGDGAGFSPFEAELRRRLWAQIVVLDVRAAQDRGTEPMIRDDDSNTIPPTNISDDDFNQDTATPVPQLAVKGPTDITFSLCTYHCSSLFLYIHAPRTKFAKQSRDQSASATSVAPQVAQTSEDDIVTRIKALETQFVTPAAEHPGHWPSALAAAVVRLTTLIIWLTIQYPFQVRQPTIRPRVSREHMLQTAIAIIELHASAPGVASYGLGAEEARDRFSWWQDGYVQWHALAVALAELCIQTEGPLPDRAWQTVDRVFSVWSHKVADERRGALWRPIRKLHRRARERRAEAQLRRQRINNGEDPTGPPPQQHHPKPPSGARKGSSAAQPRPGAASSSSPAQPVSRQQAAAHAISPLEAATQAGPTGIPFSPDFGPAFDATTSPLTPQAATSVGHASDSVPTSTPAALSGPSIAQASPVQVATARTPQALQPNQKAPQEQQQHVTTPQQMQFSSAHQWTIDFTDLDLAGLDVAGGMGLTGETPPDPLPPVLDPQSEFEMMDWSAWNDFVQDANVNDAGAETSPSSEGR